jgi:hypothetical protein
LWRYEDGQILVTTLQQGRYLPAERSPSLPDLAVGELMRFVDMRRTLGETDLLAAFEEWVKTTLPPDH